MQFCREIHWDKADVLEMDMDEFLFWAGKLNEVMEKEAEASK